MPEQLLQFHQWLLTDRNRTCGYQQAINQIIKQNDVVLDIGAGSGVLSFFACLAGARRVYAVEQNDIVSLARLLCDANGFSDRILFIRDRSQNIKLPEPVDVIVTDTGASFGLQGGTLGALLDARRRFLKPEGQILPQSVDLFVAPAEMNPAQRLDVWNAEQFGLDFSAGRPFATSTIYQVSLGGANVLADAALIANVCFKDAESSYVEGEAVSVSQRDGVMHGVGAWMRVNLIPGVSFTNSPINPTVDWARSFFPIETPVLLRPGDTVRTKISTYDGKEWRWQVEIIEGETSSEPGKVKARFDHSTLGSFPIRPEQLKKKLPEYAPRLSRKGEAEAYVLSVCDGKRTSKEIAEEVLARFADCFPTKTAATEFVSKIVERCS
ncbi:MAG TPA: 50S ribosomal protein L11 methyltransferase [Candidatus Acidoferrum sp.]